MASHCFDLLDYWLGPVTSVAGFAVNSGGACDPEDVTSAAFQIEGTVGGVITARGRSLECLLDQ